MLLFFFHQQVFIKSELKVGVIYVKENQYTEEDILDNNEISPHFEDFLQILIRLPTQIGMYSGCSMYFRLQSQFS